MNKQLFLIFSLLVAGWFYPAIVHATEPQELVEAYFEAMKNGDVQTMKSYMGGKLYQKRKVLLEENKEYPTFLMDFYKGAELETVEVRNEIVHIQIRFPDGGKREHNMVLQKNSYGEWKIVNELSFDH